MVYVISKDGKPLMPTKRRGKVRHLLKDGKAVIVKYEPFTIQLLYETTGYIQTCLLGVDPGYNKTGFSVVGDFGNGQYKALYQEELILRNDITKLLSTRKDFRKGRRYRKTRYRKCRFLNRGNTRNRDVSGNLVRSEGNRKKNNKSDRLKQIKSDEKRLEKLVKEQMKLLEEIKKIESKKEEKSLTSKEKADLSSKKEKLYKGIGRDKMHTVRAKNRKERKKYYKHLRYYKAPVTVKRNEMQKRKFPPSVISRLNAQKERIKRIHSFLPICENYIEVAMFDTQAIINPDIEGTEYQNGPLKGYDSVKEYVRIRDDYKCHYKELRPDIPCKGYLNIEHVIAKSKGGTYTPSNLVCSCAEHNRLKGTMSYKEFTGKAFKKPIIRLKQTAFMNLLKDYFVPMIEDVTGKKTYFTYGFFTKKKRKKLALEKNHINDATAIAVSFKMVEKLLLSEEYLLSCHVRKKKRSLNFATPPNRYKHNTKAIGNVEPYIKNVKKSRAKLKWCLWDKVNVNGNICFVSGFSGNGTIGIRGIDGNIFYINKEGNPVKNKKDGEYQFNVNTNKVKLICRNNNYISFFMPCKKD